ncbi:MAG: hypothetical protein AAF196_16795 [Planctomycetota bacterium]
MIRKPVEDPDRAPSTEQRPRKRNDTQSVRIRSQSEHLRSLAVADGLDKDHPQAVELPVRWVHAHFHWKPRMIRKYRNVHVESFRGVRRTSDLGKPDIESDLLVFESGLPTDIERLSERDTLELTDALGELGTLTPGAQATFGPGPWTQCHNAVGLKERLSGRTHERESNRTPIVRSTPTRRDRETRSPLHRCLPGTHLFTDGIDPIKVGRNHRHAPEFRGLRLLNDYGERAAEQQEDRTSKHVERMHVRASDRGTDGEPLATTPELPRLTAKDRNHNPFGERLGRDRSPVD